MRRIVKKGYRLSMVQKGSGHGARRVLHVVSFFLMVACLACGVTFLSRHALRLRRFADNERMVDGIRDAVIEDGEDAAAGGAGASEDGIDPNLLRSIDFDELLSINDQVCTWVYVPDSTIDYYVIQEREVGVYEYLWADIYGNWSEIGSVLVPAVPDGADDAHMLICGHNFTDASMDYMFRSVLSYEDRGYLDGHEYVYLYYPDRTERWRVWAHADTTVYDAAYLSPYEIGSAEYGEMLRHVKDIATWSVGEIEPDASDRTLFLSCCNRKYVGCDGRAFVCCVPDVMYRKDAGTVSTYSHETHRFVG